MRILVALGLLLGGTAWAGPYKVLRMPLTPSDHREEFHALIKKKEAGSVQWTSDSAGFECIGKGDFVEVWVRKATWPGVVPEAIQCASELGVVKAKVDLYDEVLKTMFVGDGSLVLARARGESSEFRGDPPRKDVGIQQGNTEATGIHCKIEPGPILVVRAKDSTEDVATSCTLRTSSGGTFSFPVVLRTALRETP
ncbi:MAG: hypothetical protein KC656_17380 [Myxococcales bacterium]|nr:hypothetical protein [Myxococcales bacterium]MCB9672074.1 hypothetical protein [Alphaproteobacteria bacterium]MCB9693981.1 hypothetical protein [Alphaproteobacteria bacterium]